VITLLLAILIIFGPPVQAANSEFSDFASEAASVRIAVLLCGAKESEFHKKKVEAFVGKLDKKRYEEFISEIALNVSIELELMDDLKEDLTPGSFHCELILKQYPDSFSK
jgi:hypothetical protein